MNKKMYQLRKLQFPYPNTLSTLVTVMDNNDRGVTLGHCFQGRGYDKLMLYKMCEAIGEEMHTHTLVATPGVTDPNQMIPFKTKIVSPLGVRQLQYSGPTMRILSMIGGGHTKPLQMKAVEFLEQDLKSYFCMQYGALDGLGNFRRFIGNSYHLLAPTFCQAADLVCGRMEVYHDVIRMVSNIPPADVGEYLRKQYVYNYIKYPFGLAANLAAGMPYKIREPVKMVPTPPRDLGGGIGKHVQYINPHLMEDLDTPYACKHLKESYFHLMDIASHCFYEEFSITIDFADMDNLTVNFCHDLDNRGVHAPITTSEEDARLERFGIDFQMLTHCLSNVAESVSILEDVSHMQHYNITICKTCDDVVLLIFDAQMNSYGETFVQYLDMNLFQLATPALAPC